MATVVDGDTLNFEGSGERVRLYGIDAPESSQTCDDASGKRYLCGTKAAEYLADLVGRSGQVTCFWSERDRYDRPVAECVKPDNTVLNAEMVRAGFAIVFKRYRDGRYDPEEAQAKAAQNGLWAGTFVQPEEWRRGERLASEQASTGQSANCPIKGNISGSGRIYHSPGQENYAGTQIDVARGERWFCSAEEAKAAGWRPAGR
ncbi:thermonuclease family protein [Aureimonas pseudogalii]|uniref:Endonuclease YncB(Thermonuclease family) n=1 Tax=Aureimonas pseudogalii TaxID=1744844 RepID=A0A7W6H964_9HYPH|nr:thermonuclease family protein [Aureimonas pseudogalii]MBB4000906.1 endonuclease YncB(thermonuclease family) [Aureimonas pseudogalii]